MHAFQLFEIAPTGKFVIHKIHGLYPTFDGAAAAAKEIMATTAPFCGYRVHEVRRTAATHSQRKDRRGF
jgi:hypothetical protein